MWKTICPIIRVGFWQNGFFADFYFWAAGFFRGFSRRIFFSSVLWEKCPEKSSRKIPEKILQNLYNKNPPTHFCRLAGATININTKAKAKNYFWRINFTLMSVSTASSWETGRSSCGFLPEHASIFWLGQNTVRVKILTGSLATLESVTRKRGYNYRGYCIKAFFCTFLCFSAGHFGRKKRTETHRKVLKRAQMHKNVPFCTDACNTPVYYTPVSVHPIENLFSPNYRYRYRLEPWKCKSCFSNRVLVKAIFEAPKCL